MKGLSNAVLNIKHLSEKKARKYTLECGNRIISKTPVGNPDLWDADFKNVATNLGWTGAGYVGGALRGNWQVSMNVPIKATIDRIDKSGAAALSDIEREAQRIKIGDVMYISNNLPYAARIEFMGYSGQAPAGMMRVSVAEVAAMINAGRG